MTLLKQLMLLLVFLAIPLLARDLPPKKAEPQWPGFRGENAQGVQEGFALPSKLSKDNLAWKINLPGEGKSSPVIWNDVVIITAAVENKAKLVLGIYAINKKTGKLLWKNSAGPVGNYERLEHYDATLAGSTPTTDGNLVFVQNAYQGLNVSAFKLKTGEKVWDRSLWTKEFTRSAKEPTPSKDSLKPIELFHVYGAGSSPALSGNHLVILADSETNSFVTCLDKTSGDIIWARARQSSGNWSTPVFVKAKLKDNKTATLAVINGGAALPLGERPGAITPGSAPGKMTAYVLANGKEAWSVLGTTAYVVPVPLLAGPWVLSSSGRMMGPIMAVDPHFDNNQKLGDRDYQWRIPMAGSYTSSGVVYQKTLYSASYSSGILSAYGIFNKFDKENSDDVSQAFRLWRHRITGRNFDSSLIAGDGKLFLGNRDGEFFVFNPTLKEGEKTSIISKHQFENDRGERDPISATPAIHQGSLLIRTESALYHYQAK